MKYYYLNTVYRYINNDTYLPQCFAIVNEHPLTRVATMNTIHAEYETILCSWQEITAEEYDIYDKLYN